MSTTEQQPARSRFLYDARKAIEHVQTLLGIHPIRLFAIFFPLWDVETTATQTEGRPYELLEKYIERGIDKGYMHTIEELAHFFGLQNEMVKKILHFLDAIGHVTCTGNQWNLTPLGMKSVAEGTNYIAKEKRVRFYFDGYTSQPLRKEHYTRKVHILTSDEMAESLQLKTAGYRFYPIFSITQWQTSALSELEAKNDKRDYNVPPEMQDIRALNCRTAYLPMYIIETRSQAATSTSPQYSQKPYYLTYTGIKGMHDTYFEKLINQNPAIYSTLRGEQAFAPRDLWSEWLSEKGITGVLPLERADGSWQVILPKSTFEGEQAKVALTKIGEYDLKHGHLIQTWCNDRALRRKAALDRLLKIVRNKQQYIKRQTVQEQLLLLAEQLQTDELEFSDLRQRAIETTMHDIVQILDKL